MGENSNRGTTSRSSVHVFGHEGGVINETASALTKKIRESSDRLSVEHVSGDQGDGLHSPIRGFVIACLQFNEAVHTCKFLCVLSLCPP